MSTPRRRFLGWLGSASLLGIVPRPELGGTVRRSMHVTDVNDDRDRTHAPPVADVWDMSWTSRVTGKYKAVFDSPESASGAAIYRAVSWCEQYKEVYGATRAEMTPVVVLRHNGLYLAMKDEFWGVVDAGKELKERDEKGRKWTKSNPVGAAAAAANPSQAKFSLEHFIADGGIALACAWSFGGAAAMLGKKEKLERAAARDRAKELLIPGVILQPNGIFAALRAQEAGCSYILAS